MVRLGVKKAKEVRDLWAHADLTGAETEYSAASVPAHGVVTVRVWK